MCMLALLNKKHDESATLPHRTARCTEVYTHTLLLSLWYGASKTGLYCDRTAGWNRLILYCLVYRKLAFHFGFYASNAMLFSHHNANVFFSVLLIPTSAAV